MARKNKTNGVIMKLIERGLEDSTTAVTMNRIVQLEEQCATFKQKLAETIARAEKAERDYRNLGVEYQRLKRENAALRSVAPPVS